MSKHYKNIIYSDIFENVDIELASYLRKCDNGKNFHVMKWNEKEKLWKAILNVIKSNNISEFSNENLQILKYCTELILHILSSSNCLEDKSSAFIDIVKFLISNELLVNSHILINSISKITEYLLAKTKLSEDIHEIEYFTLNYLLELCTSEKPLISDLHRLNNIRKGITSAPFEKMFPLLKPLLIKLVQIQFVINSENGQRFIAQALLLSSKIMIEIHRTIVLELSTCQKKNASDYGRIYIISWQNASNEMKVMLEKNCFQHLMETFLKEQRTSLELNKNARNIFQVLEVWHSERKKNCPNFVSMITNAYQPILWKYLQSGFNVHRCNAADVFFKAFPLVRSNDDIIESEKLFKIQYETMLNSLSDDCHIVRIIAIREVCNIISHYWNSFNSIQIQSLMTIITKECAKDASSAEVRRMVYVGLQNLVKSSLSCDYTKQILPILSNNIHDVNQKVRIAFIQLLICIKDKKDPSFKYTDVVSMSNIQYRLAEDNAAVGQWIVKLLLKNYYSEKMSVEEWTKRFIYLIKTYNRSYRNFFFYSSKSLPLSDAFTIIYEILTQLGLFVLSKSEINQENDENIVEKPKPKKKGHKKVPLSSWNKSNGSSKTENSQAKKWAFDDPEIVQGLFDIVTILWVLHDSKLQNPENEEMRLKLFDTYLKYAQPFINYYKDCSLFMSVLSLSGNIPVSLLRHNSITLPGYCIKMLKSINIEKCEENNENVICMLIALVKWGRGAEIIEQVSLWLDAAFETQNMNETILPRRKVKITETIQPNSVAAIYILDNLLKKEYVKLNILKKNYFELFRLWKFMARIKNLIENRLEQGEPFEEDLVSDQFLICCLKRYLKLIPLLNEDERTDEEKKNEKNDAKKEEGFVNRQKEMESMIDWAENLLFPLLQQEELEDTNLDFIVQILEDVLYVSDNMIIVHMVNSHFYFKVAYLALKLINTKYAVYFINAISRITVALNQSAKLLFQVSDDLKIFSTVIPSLLSHSLNTLTKPVYSSKEIEKIEKDLPNIKLHFGKILATYQDNLKTNFGIKEKARQLKFVVGFFVDCIIDIIAREMPLEYSAILSYSNFSQLPPIAASLFTLFYNKKTWTSLFIHVLNGKCESQNEDVKTLISCLLILYMYAQGDKKANQNDIEKALSLTAKTLILKKNKINEGHVNKRTEDLIVTESQPLNNVLTPEILESQRNALRKLSLTQEDSIKAFSRLSSSQTGKNNSEEDFFGIGMDFIQQIENILKTKSIDAEDSP